MTEPEEKRSWLDRPLFHKVPVLTGEIIIFLLIVLLAGFSRLYGLGDRTMSHDENSHVYYSWQYATTGEYQHTPTTHGPLQFHLVALTFFLFGNSDFTARLPHAIASILTIVLLWKWRRYLGKPGTIIAAALMLVSPYMLYYGRYARNEAFVALFGVATLYAMLRYLETGKHRYLILLTLATALHFTSKETAFIYTAQAMLFLAAYLVIRVSRSNWKNDSLANIFLITLASGVLLSGAAIAYGAYMKSAGIAGAGILAWLIALAGIFLLAAVVLVLVGYGWQALCRERSFDMLILLGTFVLPQLAAFPVKALGWDPLAYNFTWPGWNLPALWSQGPVRTFVVLLPLCLISIAVGVLWNPRRWMINAAIFWGIFIVFYSSVFTNLPGIATGLVGSLGYWLEQQGVNRGSQPWYYYWLIQIPIYEFLPALGVLLAAWFGFRRKAPLPHPDEGAEPEIISEGNHTFSLLFWWTISSLVAFSVAGEKMPWLTVHIALPMILLSGWALGQVVERLDRATVRERRGLLTAVLMTVFVVSLLGMLLSALGANPPFQGKMLGQLSATSTFLLAAFLMLASGGGVLYLLSGWEVKDALRLAALVLFGLLFAQTARTAFRAAYILPNDAREYLVYAHGTSGVKEVMAQVARISNLTAGGEQALTIYYDKTGANQGVGWPFLWYLRNYRNAKPFTALSEELRGAPVILLDQNNAAAIRPFIGEDYYVYTYNRIVWPNQDYFALTGKRIRAALASPAMRSALWQIWFNRDYTGYAAATGEKSLDPANWQPASQMQLLIRKDIAAKVWDYGIVQETVPAVDPYEPGRVDLKADVIFGVGGSMESQFNLPRGIALAPDGTLYVADTSNDRIQHFDASGNLLGAWGTSSPGCPYAENPPANIPTGTFCEPWGVAVSPDGEWVYVADTWNHRIQKFSPDGKSVTAWGTFSQDGSAYAFYGPRAVAVDAAGHVLVADTGNKRIAIFDADGKYLSEVGSGGTLPGQFEEPVGLALDKDGNLYVADTWNQRVQAFVPVPGSDPNVPAYSASLQWDIDGWLGNSNDNKPYLAIDNQGHIFVTDPEGFRVLEFTTDGVFVRMWGDYGTAPDQFGLAGGVAADSAGHVWVSDTPNNRIMRFTMP